MGAQASKVQQEVLDAYRPYLLATTEQLHTVFKSPELLPAYEQFKVNFGHFDTDGNGEMSWDEFVASVTTFEGKQYTVNMDLYRFMFEVFDSDGSGSISLDEALLMFHNVHSTSRFCDCCARNLSALADAGFCCSKCYEEMQLGWKADGLTWDICSSCYKGGQGPGVSCKSHGPGSVVRIEELHRALGTPAAALLSNPLAEAAAAADVSGPGVQGFDPHGFECLCCGEVHTVVLSYLRPELLDLHIRPVMENNNNTGKAELKGFVCEFCAVQVCGTHSSSDNMWWDPSAASIGSCSNPTSCGRRMRCRKGDTPAAAGTFKGHSQVVQAAKERHAAHCLTCRDKMDSGLLLFEPARLQQGRVAGDTRPRDQTLTCHCCGLQHQEFNLGHKVDSYLQPGPQGSHMTHVGGGKWVCEFCCTALCAECGTTRNMGLKCAEGLWSNPEFYCSPTCAAAGGNRNGDGLNFKTAGFSRSALKAAASSSTHVHCRGCRGMLLQGDMLDLAAEQRQQQRLQRRLELQQQMAGMILDHQATKNAKGQTKETHTEFCCCCQEKHFVVNMGRPADSYLAPQEQPHMMPLEGDRWLCEFCFTTVCKDCGEVACNTHAPERALWSKPFNCGCDDAAVTVDGSSAYGFSREEVLRRADDVHLVHCRPCRDKIVKGTLLDKAKLSGAKKAPKTASEQLLQQQQEVQKQEVQKQQQKQQQQKQQQQKQQQQQQQKRPGQGGMTQRDWQLFGTKVLTQAAVFGGSLLIAVLNS